MLTLTEARSLFDARFRRNFWPAPARPQWALGQLTPDFELPDATYECRRRLADYRDRQPVVLAFARIFTARTYCPLCYPHLIELNRHYPQLQAAGAELLLVASTNAEQSRQVVRDLGLAMPLLSDPRCTSFRAYGVGQALGAPLPAQFVLDARGRLRYRHLFSFLSPNAGVERLRQALTDGGTTS